MKKMTLDDLRKLRQQKKDELDKRDPDNKTIQVTVGMGTCGIAAGARDVVATFMTEMSTAGVTSASLHQTGCAGLCEEEPMATITTADGTMYRYGLLDKDKVHSIVTDHLVGGTPVDAYLIKT